MADKEIVLDREEPAATGKKADKSKQDKPKKETDGFILPVLIEFTVTVSAIFLAIAFFTIVGVSFVTGATVLDFILRTSISLLLMGGLLIIIDRQISFGMLTSTATGEEKSEQKQPDEKKEVELPVTSEVK